MTVQGYTAHVRALGQKTVHFERHGETLCLRPVGPSWLENLTEPVNCRFCLRALAKNEREVAANRARLGLPALEP